MRGREDTLGRWMWQGSRLYIELKKKHTQRSPPLNIDETPKSQLTLGECSAYAPDYWKPLLGLRRGCLPLHGIPPRVFHKSFVFLPREMSLTFALGTVRQCIFKPVACLLSAGIRHERESKKNESEGVICWHAPNLDSKIRTPHLAHKPPSHSSSSTMDLLSHFILSKLSPSKGAKLILGLGLRSS